MVLQAREQAVDEVAEIVEEAVADDAIPLAADVEGAARNASSNMPVIQAYSDGEMRVIPSEQLAALPADVTAITVLVVTGEKGEGVSDWEEVRSLLSLESSSEIRLDEDIQADSPAVIKGEKTLDLNGHTITSVIDGDAPSLFVVEANAAFIIDDSASNHLSLETVSPGQQLPKPEKANAGNLIAGEYGSFATDWTGQTAIVEDDIVTYYVTRSYPSSTEVGLTDEFKIEHTIDMGMVGTLQAETPQNLVYLEKDSSLTINGGRLNLAEGIEADIHAIDMGRGGTLTMNGGFITNYATTGSGGAISADSGERQTIITIQGNAVIAGNKARGNGGAIWAKSSSKENPTQIVVSGHAVLAGNSAYERNENDDSKILATQGNGGAIYVHENCEVVLGESSVIAGNTALADGGGVYVRGHTMNSDSKNTLSILDNAMITNNRAESDRSFFHPTDRTEPTNKAYESGFWQNVGGGGGGIFTLDDTVISGGQITANFAADGGGGIWATGGYGCLEKDTPSALPMLTIASCAISSNYAGTSEGGGINAMPALGSKIVSGYITNNMTATYFDYGGGGLFLTAGDHGKTTGMTLSTPLVKNNVANGLGGGIAACTNGFVVSSNAAVFDNKALAENATQNPNEYGDQWVLEKNLHAGEPKEGYGLAGKIDACAYSADFFCAKESKIHNQMLGGGFYEWEGYTTGAVKAETVSYTRPDNWFESKYVQVNSDEPLKVTNVFYHRDHDVVTVIVPAESQDVIKKLAGYEMRCTTVDVDTEGKPLVTLGDLGNRKVIASVTEGSSYGDTCDEGDVILDLHLAKMDAGVCESPTDFELKGAFTREDDTPKPYPLYKVENLGDTVTFIDSDRLTMLKACPDESAKKVAESLSNLYITGNYSNMHGGGIACNDYIDIGGNELPEPKPPVFNGSLKLKKTLNRFDESSGSATAVFRIKGYVDAEAAQAGIKLLYENVVGISFGPSDSVQVSERVLSDLPTGYYVIAEEFYSGDNFLESRGGNVREVEVKGGELVDGAEEVPTVEFTNTYDDESSYGTGVVNRYAKGEDGYAFTQDDQYIDRTGAVMSEEGRKS